MHFEKPSEKYRPAAPFCLKFETLVFEVFLHSLPVHLHMILHMFTFCYILSDWDSIQRPDACQMMDKHLSCKLLSSLFNLAVPATYGVIFYFMFKNSDFHPQGDCWCKTGQLTSPERAEGRRIIQSVGMLFPLIPKRQVLHFKKKKCLPNTCGLCNSLNQQT